MELDKRRWHVTWFFLSLAILDKYRGRRGWENEEIKYEDGTNLCHFIRVTTVWAPLVVLLHIATYGMAVAILTIRPIYLFGWTGYLSAVKSFAVGIVLVVAFAAIAALGELVAKKISHKRNLLKKQRQVEQELSADSSTELVVVDCGPSFLDVWREHLKSAKQQICPIISFKNYGGSNGL